MGEGMGQGLYVCLPAEQLTLAGFAQGGEADTMAPGPLLAAVVHAVAGDDGSGLGGCSDDQLVGIISAARRMESRTAWTLLAATAEFAARHDGTRPDDAFAADELAAELHLTALSARGQMDYASTVATRLPQAFAALAAGRVHPVHVRIIEDEASILSAQDAATADAILAGAAPGMTFGELRSAARKLVLQLDPEAVQKRKDAARGEAHVRRFREDSGNAGMIARELPAAEVLASWQHVEQRALDLRAAGMPGSLRELRIRAYLDLLQERDSRDQPPGPGPDPAGPVPAGREGTSDPGPTDLPDPGSDLAGPDPAGREAADEASDPDQSPPDSQPPAPPSPDPGPDGPGGPRGNGGSGGPGSRPGPAPAPAPGPGATTGPSVAALVTITVPWATVQGQSETPGEAAGFGVLDGDEARDLVAAAARHPRTRWCITGLNPDGTAATHGCIPGRHPPPGLAAACGPAPGPAPPDGTGPPPDHPPGVAIKMVPVARGPCDHARGEVGYHPSRTLTHVIRARSATCTAPGCSRPAAACDLDHTRPWDQGGPTCECNLAPLCRHHHRCKQAQGWQLEQPEPGVLKWRTPSGRKYTTTPTAYSA